jgi:site-specific DNA-methyltransferase (cytosine-N4-specific)
MHDLLQNGYKAKLRPSGHDISEKFGTNNGGAIPPNLIALPNTESNSYYLRYCRDRGLKPHPARFPARLPEYFVRMLTDMGDFVLDPFGGSCVTGEVCERLERKWICCEIVDEYIEGAKGRFATHDENENGSEPEYYRLYSSSTMWQDEELGQLPEDGGQTRPQSEAKTIPDFDRHRRGRDPHMDLFGDL